MHLFFGKFCTTTDGTQRTCTCQEAIFSREQHEIFKETVHFPQKATVIELNLESSNISSADCICDRKNFDSLLWALVTVFQVCLVYFL